MPAITVENLSKTYGSFRAVRNVSFVVHPGRVTALLGPNGSGKSTTMRMMVDLCRPDRGRTAFDSVPSHEARPYAALERPAAVVGLLLDASAHHGGRSVRETVRIAGMMAGVSRERGDQCLRTVGLGEVGRRRVGALSLGMRQRLGLAIALLGSPRVLVLDEPGNGLDPEGLAWLNGFLVRFARAGGAVFVSSHHLAEIEAIADDVVVLDRGRVRYAGPAQALDSASSFVTTLDDAAFTRHLEASGVTAELLYDQRIRADAGPETIGRLSVASGIPLTSLVAGGAGLATYFLDNTNGEYQGRHDDLMHLSEPAAPVWPAPTGTPVDR